MRVTNGFFPVPPRRELLHMLGLEGDVAIAPFKIAVDVIGGDAILNDVSGLNPHLINGVDTALTD